MTTTRRSYAGGAKAGALTASIDTTVLSVACDALVGWPDGSQGDFAAVINRGGPTEEKVLVHTRTGANLTLTRRGYDGTSPANHGATETIEHCHTAIDDDEANDHSSNPYGHGIDNPDRIVGKDKVQTLTHKTMDFGPTGSNVATNIPASAVPSLATLPADVADLAADLTTLDTDLHTNYYDKTTSEGTGTGHGPPFLNQTQGDARYLQQAAAPNNFITQAQADARYAPKWADTGWLTDASNFHPQTGWTLSSVRYRKMTSGPLSLAEVIIVVSRSGAAITVPSTGNVAGTNIVQVPAFPDTPVLTPAQVSNMVGPYVGGRVAVAEVDADGMIVLQAVGGSGVDIASGEQMTLRGLWLVT